MNMEKDTYIWAAAHNILPEQRAELEKDGSKVFMLSDMEPDLYRKLCNLKPESDLYDLAIALIRICNRIGAVLVHPAGSPAFQNVLGRTNEQALSHNARIQIAYAISVFQHIGFQYV